MKEKNSRPEAGKEKYSRSPSVCFLFFVSEVKELERERDRVNVG